MDFNIFLLASSRDSEEPPSAVVEDEDWRENRVGFVGMVDMIVVVRLKWDLMLFCSDDKYITNFKRQDDWVMKGKVTGNPLSRKQRTRQEEQVEKRLEAGSWKLKNRRPQLGSQTVPFPFEVGRPMERSQAKTRGYFWNDSQDTRDLSFHVLELVSTNFPVFLTTQHKHLYYTNPSALNNGDAIWKSLRDWEAIDTCDPFALHACLDLPGFFLFRVLLDLKVELLQSYMDWKATEKKLVHVYIHIHLFVRLRGSSISTGNLSIFVCASPPLQSSRFTTFLHPHQLRLQPAGHLWHQLYEVLVSWY